METKKQIREREQTEARDKLREMVKPGDTVQTILRHVSRSGMQRAISVVIDGEDYSWLVARACGFTLHPKYEGLKVDGCGMDMGSSVVYELSYALHPNGFECIGEKCPSNDHSNGDRDYSPHHHASGGYALRQGWL